MAELNTCIYCGDKFDAMRGGVDERGEQPSASSWRKYCSLKCYRSDTAGRSFPGGTGKRLKWKNGENNDHCEWCGEYFTHRDAWHFWGDNFAGWTFAENEYAMENNLCCSKCCAQELCAYKNEKDGTDEATKSAQAEAQAAEARAERETARKAEKAR